MILLDANVLIALLDTRDALHRSSFDLLEHHEWDVFCTSAVTLTEVLVRPAGRGQDQVGRRRLDEVGVKVLALGSGTAATASRLRASEAMSLPDATVLATAQQARAALAMFDERLRRVAGRTGVDIARLP